MSDAIVTELRRLAEAVERNNEILEVIAGRRLTTDDRAILEMALPLVHRITTGSVFSSADLLLFSKEHAPLRTAIGSLNAKQIGKLFARAVGTTTINGYRIHRSGDDGSALWLVTFANKAD